MVNNLETDWIRLTNGDDPLNLHNFIDGVSVTSHAVNGLMLNDLMKVKMAQPDEEGVYVLHRLRARPKITWVARGETPAQYLYGKRAFIDFNIVRELPAAHYGGIVAFSSYQRWRECPDVNFDYTLCAVEEVPYVCG